MGNALRHVRGESQKNIVRFIEGLSGKYSRWDIWQDFIIMSAIAIANTMGGPQVKAREEMYRSRAEKYSAKELEVFADMLLEVVAELERDPEQDFLGELFMALGLGNEWKGQFFTPYSVCRAMSAMSYAPDMTARIEKQGWISVNDPACGAGALLVAFANECRRQHMFGWVGNSLIKTFWSKLDKPMTRRLIDTVLDSANIWLNGLVGMGYLLGARVEMLENENPLTNLMAGIIKLHVYMTPPSPAQEIDFVLEYDASYVTSALQG